MAPPPDARPAPDPRAGAMKPERPSRRATKSRRVPSDEPAPVEGVIIDADDTIPAVDPALADLDLPGGDDLDDVEADAAEPSLDLELANEDATRAGAAHVPLAGGKGVLVRDALTRYLAEVSRFPRLSPEEEHSLAVSYREAGDREALARLVTSNLRLVVAVALSFRRAFANVLDLIQEGNIGLLQALERFDPYKGTRLSTYATWWIRSAIVKYLLDNWRLVRVGTTNARRKLLYNLRKEKARLEALGLEATPKLLAENLGATPEDVVAVQQALGASDHSLDAPVGEDGSATHGDFLPSHEASPERQAAENEVLGQLREVLDAFEEKLSVRERALLRERLLSDDPLTLQEIASREGVTREAVRQTEQRLTTRLKAFLAERFPDAGEIRFGDAD